MSRVSLKIAKRDPFYYAKQPLERAQMLQFLSPTPLVINPYTNTYQAKRMANHFLANPLLVGVVGLRCIVRYTMGRSLTPLWIVLGGLIFARRSIEWILCTRTPVLGFCTPAESLPPLFYQELERSNEQKTDKEPLALHLWAAEDYNEGVTGIGGAGFVLQTASTHRVAIRTIATASSIQSTLRDVEKHHGPIDVLYVHGHGKPHVIGLSTPPMWRILLAVTTGNKKWFSDYVCKGSTPLPFAGKTIVLLSCSTGESPEDGGLSIAEELAAKTQKVVWAPVQDVGKVGLLLYSQGKDLGVAWYQRDSHGADVMACFGPEGRRILPETSSRGEALQKSLQKLSIQLDPLVKSNGPRCRNEWHGYLRQLQEFLPENLKQSLVFPVGFEGTLG